MEANLQGFESRRMVEPFVDSNYDSRTGYDENFLGIPVPMPSVADLSVVAELNEGGHIIPYAHFSIIMHKQRRLALLTAANVDGSEARRKPEEGRDYSRKGLGGLKSGDIEKWRLEPRLDPEFQLPDTFYTKDRGNFDRGHVVRRNDVTWGADYDEVRRANGDTYHVTNCSPQVSIFNQSRRGGEWGKLENFILKQAAKEKLCIFAGPVFDDENDKIFKGLDDKGPVAVQIPSVFWKVIVSRKGDSLETFGFVLEQDLSNSDVEFNVTAEWIGKMITIESLENRVPDLNFSESVRSGDQADRPAGLDVQEASGFERYES